MKKLRGALKKGWFESAVLLVMAGIIAWQLFIPPLIGIADNGDFDRFMDNEGLAHRAASFEDRYFQYFNSKYLILAGGERRTRYLSSTELFVRAARWLNIRLVSRQVFDIRVLGGLYTALYLFGMGMILVSSRALPFGARLLLAALLVLVFTDSSYVAFFNTMYSEPTGLTAFIIAIGAALLIVTGRWRSWPALLLYFAACAILVTAKPIYAPLAVLFAAFGLYLTRQMSGRRRWWLGGGLAALLCVTGLVYNLATPEWMRVNANYIVLFADLLKHSPAPEQDLADMGFEADWRRMVEVDPYAANSPLNNPAFRSEFGERVGSSTVPLFYLRRPGRFFALLDRVSPLLFTGHWFMGYYEKESGKPPLTHPYGLWATIRGRAFPKSVWFLGAFFVAGLAASALIYTRSRGDTAKGLAALAGLLLLLVLASFLIPVLAMGQVELVRYLLLFNAAIEMVLILALVAFAGRLYRIRKLKAAPQATAGAKPSSVAGRGGEKPGAAVFRLYVPRRTCATILLTAGEKTIGKRLGYARSFATLELRTALKRARRSAPRAGRATLSHHSSGG